MGDHRFFLLTILFAGSLSAQTQPLGIEQVVAEALRANLDLAAERANIPVAESRGVQARLRPNPVVTVSGMTLDLLGAHFNPNTPVGPNTFVAHTDFPIERPSKRQNRIAVADLDKSVANLNLRESSRDTILAAQSAFLDILQAKENLALAQSNLESLNGIVQINETRVRTGDLAPVELERSRVAALQFQNAVEQATLVLDQAKARLQLLLGRTALSPDFDVTGEFRRESLSDSQPDLLARALERRPDLLSLRESQARSASDLKLQLANGKVDFVAGVEYSRQWAWGLGGNTLGFSLAIPLPVFNRNQGEVARATAEQSRAAARVKAMQASLNTEVETAWMQYNTSKRLLDSIEANLLSRAKKVRETTEYSYRRGEASLVEFLDAQRAYNDAVQSYNEARANFARSLYVIDAVSGATVTP